MTKTTENKRFKEMKTMTDLHNNAKFMEASRRVAAKMKAEREAREPAKDAAYAAPVALATIELDRPEGGRGELYWSDGTIWCREPEGNAYSTGERCTPIEALDHIARSWGVDWDLLWGAGAQDWHDQIAQGVEAYAQAVEAYRD